MHRVPARLRERLGEEATADLVALFTAAHSELLAEVSGMVGERFERRLVEETSRLRVGVVEGFAAVRQEMAKDRVEFLKWAFVFRVGQFFAMASLVAVLIRFLRYS